MKSIKNIMMVGAMALFVMSCKNEAKPEVKTVEVANETSKMADPNATYAKAEFTIDGMTCAIGCAKTIEKKIAKMDGVKSATVDFDKKLAMVEYNVAKVTPVLLEETVTKVSDAYEVSGMKTVTTN
ncbi:heavy-metal-associated domain-containing protein [Mariniflexile rhizosphaerae]|uniref:heavy-metal-associated domain-containing protein n=1 Tax=unclassified Mariniflexile TaxID=2643887 RepID=UPI000CC0BB8B|nr:heavy metal-associated domain-containing protein [Mariniflexile sp. TRM1-10]PLB20578.1 MAG: Heavy metal transport/detoxification protein [Flavobacteriaceae bacterium FS1-H7996/R]